MASRPPLEKRPAFDRRVDLAPTFHDHANADLRVAVRLLCDNWALRTLAIGLSVARLRAI
jgi:hypothetical protein